MGKNNTKLVVIVGPTASGKSALAMRIAENYDGELICADSRTIYKGLDIGTAKPSKQDQAKIKHHLLDIKEPNQSFSVAEFKTFCEKAISLIKSRGKLPIIVGGSGLYIDAVLYDYSFRTKPANKNTAKLTDTEVFEKVQSQYPELAGLSEYQNSRRAHQLLELGPAAMSDRSKIKIPCKIIGLLPKTATLKQNIEHRTELMLNNRFVHEAENLVAKYGLDSPGLQTIGYKQVIEYPPAKQSLSELKTAINRATYKYAKRQITWFKRNKDIVWVETPDYGYEIAQQYLKDNLIQ